ncbi:hypothetical protein PLICRDRAFT_181010 [Plicaturopsis crispa FD-325 SS-3]|uniref:Uncharacterized protein n=1 Tax=Plicaturopsis crispa FD-325 SS-3 TaxID=944288 RepID=A0A0C9SJY8_PLICR|nr:hypothetical protein PLICRDRAFT_181010 [Plicaturopsis crispa FD-325 SS-3]
MSNVNFIRAASPFVSSIAQANPGSNSSSNRAARHTALQAATTVDELIAMVPQDYRHVLRTPLLEVAALTTKLWSARSTLEKWNAHKTAKTYPPHIRSKAPEVQLSKDFGENAVADAHRTRLHDAHKAYMDATLDNCIRAKSDDVAFLERALDPTKLFEQLAPLVAKRGEEILAKSKLPIFKSNEQGGLELDTWEENTVAKDLATQVYNDCVVYAFRIISIVDAREHTVKAKLSAKKTLATAADVEMADASKPGPSIQSLIDKAVSARLKKVSTTSAKAKPGKDGKKKSSTSKSTRAPELPKPYIPRAGRKPPRVVGGKPSTKKAQGKGKGKGRA